MYDREKIVKNIARIDGRSSPDARGRGRAALNGNGACITIRK